jgi:hypothetical protein
MSGPGRSGRIASASDAMEEAVREELARTRTERQRRHMLRLIDLALDQCERRNLEAAGPGRGQPPLTQLPPPAMALALIEWLQMEQGGELRAPACNQQALDELFRLQEAYLLEAPEGDGELDEQELEGVAS